MSNSSVAPWTAAHQTTPLSMGFPRQGYWSGLLFSSQGDLPDPGIKPASPALAGRFFTTESLGKPLKERRCAVLSHSFMSDSLPMNTGVGSLSLLQGIFLTQKSNRGLLHCRWIILAAELPGKPEGKIAFHKSCWDH